MAGAACRKVKSAARPVAGHRLVVRFILYRRRLLDFDNAGGAVKFLCDALRYEGVIPDDSPQHIVGTVEQVKVRHESEERTEITVEEAKGQSSDEARGGF